MSDKKTTEKHLPESKRKTLPRDFASYHVFKLLQTAVRTKTHTVSGWIEVGTNREKLANALSGVMEGQKLTELREGGTKVLERWAKKLRNQLRSSGNRKRSRGKTFQQINMGRNTLRRRRDHRDRVLSSKLKNLLAHFNHLETKFHNITSSGPAVQFRELACNLLEVASAFEKNTVPLDNSGHNDMDRAPSALPRNSVVWVLKGHIFENSIVKQVSRIIREISLDEIDIIWSNFTISNDLALPTIAQLEIRANNSEHLNLASSQLKKLFANSSNLQYGPPGSPGLVPRVNRVAKKNSQIALYKLVGHLVNRNIFRALFEILKHFKPTCSARILCLEIIGMAEKTTAIIEIDGEPYAHRAVVEKFSTELHEAEKYDSSPNEKTKMLRLSEEDVSQLRRSWALDQYADAESSEQYADAHSVGRGSIISDCPIPEFANSSRANEGIAALETKKQPGRTSPASLRFYARSGSFSSSSVDCADDTNDMHLETTELVSSASHRPVSHRPVSHMINSHVDYNYGSRYSDGSTHDPPPLQLGWQEEASRSLPTPDTHQPATMMHYHQRIAERPMRKSTGGHHASSSSHLHAQIVPLLMERLRTAEAQVASLKAELRAAQMKVAHLMHSRYTGGVGDFDRD